MKVTLDLDRLLANGSIDATEYARLAALSTRATGMLAFNVLVAFGVIAVSGATLALIPTTTTAIALGAVVLLAGMLLSARKLDSWRFLANVCVVVGALLVAGGVIKQGEGSVASFLATAAFLACAAALARSALLACLAVLALSSCLGTRTGYLHAAYFLGVQEPTLTILAFLALGIVVYALSRRLPPAFRNVALAAVGTSVFLVNFGFWIGSLWGDGVGWHAEAARRLGHAPRFAIAEWVFAVAWAIGLIAAGIWAWWRGHRWLVNVVAVFAAIHLYTQWFERLGATPSTVLAGGIAALVIALMLRAYNVKASHARML